jgi:hypothetical protein
MRDARCGDPPVTTGANVVRWQVALAFMPLKQR